MGLSPMKASHVHRHLRNAVPRERLQSGVLLQDRDLAVKFRVSRTPICEALRQLERDGQVRVTPHAGAEEKAALMSELCVYPADRLLYRTWRQKSSSTGNHCLSWIAPIAAVRRDTKIFPSLPVQNSSCGQAYSCRGRDRFRQRYHAQRQPCAVPRSDHVVFVSHSEGILLVAGTAQGQSGKPKGTRTTSALLTSGVPRMSWSAELADAVDGARVRWRRRHL